MKSVFYIYIILLMMLSACNNKVSTKTTASEIRKEQGIVYYWKDLTFQHEELPCPGRILPLKYRLLATDYAALRKLLLRDKAPATHNYDTINLNIPMPDSSWQLFRIHRVEVMAPELAAKFPEIRTYAGVNPSNPAEHIRLDISPNGFSSMILSEAGTMIIDPYCKGDTVHVICYNRNQLPPDTKQPFEE
jgi:hypothetical protein